MSKWLVLGVLGFFSSRIFYWVFSFCSSSPPPPSLRLASGDLLIWLDELGTYCFSSSPLSIIWVACHLVVPESASSSDFLPALVVLSSNLRSPLPNSLALRPFLRPSLVPRFSFPR